MRNTLIVLVLCCFTSLAFAEFPRDLNGDGLTVHFNDASSGTLTLNNQTFAFTGQEQNGTLTGRFKAGANEFPFTLARNGQQYVLESGGTRYALNGALPPNNPLGGNGGIVPRNGNAGDLQEATIHDDKSKLEVATIKVPAGWKLDEKLLWRPLMAQYVALNTTAFDPQTGAAVRWLPPDRFSCSPVLFNNARQQGVAPVSGGLELTDRVPSATDYITGIVIPRYRNVQGLRVVGAEPMERYANLIGQAKAAELRLYLQQGQSTNIQAARVRIEYPAGNTTIEEDIYVVMWIHWNEQANQNAIQMGMPQGQQWLFYPERVYSLAAPKGQLDRMTPALQSIQGSLHLTQVWHSYTTRLNQMIQKQVLNDQMMEATARAGIDESMKKSWEESVDLQDKIAEEVGKLVGPKQ